MTRDASSSTRRREPRRSWESAAGGWCQWWSTIERGTQVVSDRLIELAGLRAGHRVLDVATGLGEPAVTAARRVGTGGQVVAIDRTGPMLAMARERAASLGLRNIEFHEMEAEAIEFSDSTFDAVLCRFGLMFFAELEAALKEMRRVLVAGGGLAASVWSAPAEVPMISVAMAMVQQALESPLPSPGSPGPFRLADVDALKQRITRLGFADVHSEPVTVTVEFASVDEYIQFAQSVLPEREELADLPAEKQADVWQAVAESAQQHATAGSRIRFSNTALCLVGVRL